MHRYQPPSPIDDCPSVRPLIKGTVALLIIAAIVTPWVVMVNHRSSGFISQSVNHEVWDRMMTPLEQHVGPPGYYFLTVWITYFPWSLLLPLAIGLAFHRRSDPRSRFALARDHRSLDHVGMRTDQAATLLSARIFHLWRFSPLMH